MPRTRRALRNPRNMRSAKSARGGLWVVALGLRHHAVDKQQWCVAVGVGPGASLPTQRRPPCVGCYPCVKSLFPLVADFGRCAGREFGGFALGSDGLRQVRSQEAVVFYNFFQKTLQITIEGKRMFKHRERFKKLVS